MRVLITHIIHSVSGDASLRDEVIKMANYLKQQLTDVGCDVRAVPLGTQNINGQDIQLPPVLLGSIGNDPNKKTILTYGHFDVQPVRWPLNFYVPSFVVDRIYDRLR